MKNLYKKIAEVQKEMKPVIKDSTNPHFKKNYFDINAVLEEMRPIWESKGLLVIQPLTNLMGKSAITTYVIDTESGESIDSTIFLTEQTDPQKMGSAITYFRRYSLTSFFGIIGEEDDDANGTVKPPVSAPKASPSPVQSATGNGAKCAKCGAGMAISKTTGKEYCEKKCWLEPKPPHAVNPVDVALSDLPF